MNMEDINLRKQLTSVDPLSAGVVFGKEDAWDKLQVRLDAKPKRRVLPIIWWAAAAFLVLGIWIGIKVSQLGGAATPSIVAVPVQPQTKNEIQPTNETPAPIAATGSVAETAFTMKTITAEPGIQKAQTPVTDVVPIPILMPSQEAITVAAVADVQLPRLMMKQPMKLVHLNELNGPARSTGAVATDESGENEDVSLASLPVVHLNEVIADEKKPFHFIVRRKPASSGVFTFLMPSRDVNYSLDDDATQSSTKFKLRNN